MAAKKAKTTRKYRQAKTAAKPAAKEAFPGKKQAVKRDPKLKISAEDRLIAKEVSESAKADLGKNAYLKKSDYEATQKAAREKFRESMREEFGEYGGKKASPAEAEAPKKPAVKKKAVKKPATAKEANLKKAIGDAEKAQRKTMDMSKSPTKTSKSAANKAAWAKMTPEQRRNWKTTRPGAATAEAPAAMPKQSAKETPKNTKPKLSEPEVKQKVQKAMDDVEDSINRAKRPTLADLEKNEAKGLEEAKARVAAKNKALANSAKGKTQTPQAQKAKATAKPEGKAKVVKKGSRTVRASKFIAKKFPLAMLAGEVGSVAKGSTVKDLKEINRLKAKLGEKPMSAREGATTQASSLANLATMGLVGKTRRQRMDELNAKIKKKEAATAKANKGLRYGKGGESLVPGTDAYKKGSKKRPTGAGSASKPNVGAGGSTTKYTVKKGDTLSGIAKNSGLSLAEVRKLNPELMSNPKYKKGSMIWSGTKVNVKKK